MIDEEDADAVWICALIVDHPVVSAVLLSIAFVLAFCAWRNETKCSDQHCEHGHPALVEHQCQCVEPISK